MQARKADGDDSHRAAEPAAEDRLRRRWQLPWKRLGLMLVAGTLFSWFYLHTAGILIEATNQDYHRSDQSNNMRLAQRAAEAAEWDPAKSFGRNLLEWLPHRTDGVVNPLWPRIAATFASDDSDLFFKRGKWLNVALSLTFLLAVSFVLASKWTFPAALNFLLLAGLATFLPRAPWFQPEPIYYILFFLSWVCGMTLLKRNPLWLYACFGIASGLAYLAKGSILPLLLVYLGLSSYRFLAATLPPLFGKIPLRPQSAWKWKNHLTGLILFFALYALIISPRLIHSNERFGDPTHSFPSYWMWMNDFDSGYHWMAEFGSKEALQNLDPETTPSLRNYVRDHSTTEIWHRIVDGSWRQAGWLFAPRRTARDDDGNPGEPWRSLLETRGNYLAALGALVLVGAAFTWYRQRRQGTYPPQGGEPEQGTLILFVLGSLTAYLLLHGWYTQIGDGDRFMLALYPPLAFSLIAAAERIHKHLQNQQPSKPLAIAYLCFHGLLTLFLLARMLELLKHPTFS